MRAVLLTVASFMLLGIGRATADSPEPRIVLDETHGTLVISGKSRGRTYRLAISTEVLPAKTQPKHATDSPIGCDCSWEDHGNALIVITGFTLTSGAGKRTIHHRLTEQIVSPHLAEVAAALSSNGRNLFICSYLGDGAGAALAVWSLSLNDQVDWLRAGDLISDWSYPEYTDADTCRKIGESAWKQRGAKRRPFFIQSDSR
jgi:hypothetical protein